MAKRVAAVLAVCALLLAVAALVLPLIGSSTIDYRKAWAGESPHKEILFLARVPRVMLALLAGGGLAVAGVLFQALLRDALATPYTLGISSGASLGAVIAIVFGLREIAGQNGVWMAALLGAAVTLLLVLGLAAQGRRLSSFTLLLAGVTLNSIAMAMILFLQNLSNLGQAFTIARWLMGGIEPVEYSSLAVLAAAVLPAVAVACWKGREWNLLAVGEDWAAARGVSTGRLLLLGYVLGSWLTGTITALTGPIGFVGLIVPHALRIRAGADHRLLLPASFLLGGVFLAICDTVARTVLAPTEIPVGVVTALLGGPFFIWLLRNKRRSLWL